MEYCIHCGNTGVLANGESCTHCNNLHGLEVPICLAVPTQYQGVRFSANLVQRKLDESYGRYLENIIKECTKDLAHFNKNILICAPPNSGKTVFAYTVFGVLYEQGVTIPEIMDLMEARDILVNYYSESKDKIALLSSAKVAFIKIPQDLPPKFAETMSTIIERRVRNNASTIFLTSCSEEDLVAQDKFNKFKMLVGDGSYNSLEVRSWKEK